jgi:hypothetical protein
MKYVQVSLLAIVGLCMAMPVPFAFECSLLDRVRDAAQTAGPMQSIALEILERVAGGRMESASPDLEVQVGLKPGQLRGPEFKDSSLRAYALRRIGELDLPEALTYLQNLKQNDIGFDSSHLIWPAAQIALRDALLRRISDPQSKIELLERTVTEPHDAISNSAVTTWAIDQLCDRGSLSSLAIIQQSIRNRRNGQRGEDDLRFCEERMAVVGRSPNRAKALGSVLRVNGTSDDARLIAWAIYQLHSVDSREADAELERYAKEIDGLPDSPVKRELASRLPPRRPK